MRTGSFSLSRSLCKRLLLSVLHLDNFSFHYKRRLACAACEQLLSAEQTGHDNGRAGQFAAIGKRRSLGRIPNVKCQNICTLKAGAVQESSSKLDDNSGAELESIKVEGASAAVREL